MTVERLATGGPGRRVVWRVAGAGEPLLLLHGGYGAWNHWYANVEGLAAARRVLAPDIPGLGESDAPDDLASLPSIAARLQEALDELVGPRPVDVAAFSFGAGVASAMAMRHPSFLRRFALVGAGGLAAPRPEPVALESWRDAASEAERLAIHRRNLAAFMFGDPARITDAAVRFQDENTRRARVKSRPLSRLGYTSRLLATFRGPLCGIWGTRDATAAGFLAERRRILQVADPAATLTEIEGAGHWVMAEAPDEVNALLLGFLSRPA